MSNFRPPPAAAGCEVRTRHARAVRSMPAAGAPLRCTMPAGRARWACQLAKPQRTPPTCLLPCVLAALLLLSLSGAQALQVDVAATEALVAALPSSPPHHPRLSSPPPFPVLSSPPIAAVSGAELTPGANTSVATPAAIDLAAAASGAELAASSTFYFAATLSGASFTTSSTFYFTATLSGAFFAAS